MSTLLERWLYSKSGYNKFARNHASTTTSNEEDDDEKDCKSENVKQPTKKVATTDAFVNASVE
jgi:hypothetical protein